MKKIYAFLGRSLFVMSIPLLKIYFTAKPSRRVRVLLINDSDEVLLIKGWFSRQWWELPGGGIKHKEADIDAAIRETKEETGVPVPRSTLRYVSEFRHAHAVTSYQVVLYATRTYFKNPVRPRRAYAWEIIDVQWFSVKNLPKNISPLVSIALEERSKLEI